MVLHPKLQKITEQQILFVKDYKQNKWEIKISLQGK